MSRNFHDEVETERKNVQLVSDDFYDEDDEHDIEPDEENEAYEYLVFMAQIAQKMKEYVETNNLPILEYFYPQNLIEFVE